MTGLVSELSDDKTQNKAQRKQAQIDHAPHASHKAKLVKLADKIYNLRDLNRCTPQGWSEERYVISMPCMSGCERLFILRADASMAKAKNVVSQSKFHDSASSIQCIWNCVLSCAVEATLGQYPVKSAINQ